MSVPLTDQADEVEIHAQALRNQIERARADRKYARSPEWIGRNEARAMAAEAAVRTLRGMAVGQGARV